MIEDYEEETEDTGFKQLTDDEFRAARERYEVRSETIASIADDLGVTRQALSKRFAAVGAKKGSRSSEYDAEKAQKATVERFSARRAEIIEETRMTGISSLKQTRLIAQKIAIDAIKTNKPLSSVDDDLRAVGRLNKILVDNLTTSLAILQADEHVDEADLPVLTVEDLTDEDILNHHKSTGALGEDATIEDINTD